MVITLPAGSGYVICGMALPMTNVRVIAHLLTICSPHGIAIISYINYCSYCNGWLYVLGMV